MVLTSGLSAQLEPEGSQVISYFPQLADGGSSSQRWFTTMTFVNSNSSMSAAGIANFYDDNGNPLAIDFGSGAVATINFNVAPQGTITLTSTGLSPSTVTGWAVVVSSLPLQGVVQFRYAVNGVAAQGVSAPATAASLLFRSPATAATGIAVGDPYAAPLNVNVMAMDSTGKKISQGTISLPPHGHKSLPLNQIVPNLSADFRGSVVVAGPGPGTANFVALILSGDGGVISSYPPSSLGLPISQFERIWRVWVKVLDVASSLYPLGTTPNLVINYDAGPINTFATPSQNQVTVYMTLAELISDSESELAFVVAHALGHIIQARIGQLAFVPGKIEQDADAYGLFLSLAVGYDAYGAAGALGKLSMASGTAGLLSQNFDNLAAVVGADLQGSFNDRLAVIFQNTQQLCSLQSAQSLCVLYKNLFHPHFSVVAPLMVRPSDHQE
jgi:hypothetical protein